MGNQANGNTGVCVHKDGSPVASMHKVKAKAFSLWGYKKLCDWVSSPASQEKLIWSQCLT